MIRKGLLVALVAVVTANDECIKDGAVGVCMKECHSASEGVQNTDFTKICGFDFYEYEPMVCCFDHLTTSTAPVTTRSLLQTTTEDEFDSEEVFVMDTCKDIDPKLTAPRTGQKAWDMCLEYQEKLVYPCVKKFSLAFNTAVVRGDNCNHDLSVSSLVVGGTNAKRNEFPHMALLGYVAEDTEIGIKWMCGGSLISDQFVLTAGHCIRDIKYGIVSFVYIGALSKNDVKDKPDRKYGVKAIIKHPDYHSPNKYNDIALLELDRRVKLDAYTVPACLPVGGHLKYDKALATGWGLTTYGGSTADTLQKVTLKKFTSDECEENYFPTTYMVNGYNDTTQICYGDYEESKDTCEGDSGGPLQIHHDKISCMYVVIGITSMGIGCGIIGQPGIYTRVSHYVPWIESVVWP